MLFLGLVGWLQGGCFSNRLHDPTLECGGGDCQCVVGRANCNGDWSDGCEIDTFQGDAHCGGCGFSCEHGTCDDGLCVCDAPDVWNDCDDDPVNGCEELLTDDDALNCGACGKACGATEFCQSGVCTERCLNGELCDAQCVDVSKDPAHCGDCNQPCKPDEQCFESICVPCEEACDLCLTDDLGAGVPQHLVDSPSTNGLSSQCLEVSLPGAVYRFHAPVAGSYLATSFGSLSDTALSVHTLIDSLCLEIDCNDDALGIGAAVGFEAGADQEILIAVASKSALTTVHQLHITETTDGACDLGWIGWNLPTATSGDFLTAADTLQPSCAPAGGVEVAALLIAPESGYYLVDTDGSEADTVLFVLDDSCTGVELGCDDDTGDQDAQLLVELIAGQAVVVAVEQRAGSAPGGYNLHIEGPL